MDSLHSVVDRRGPLLPDPPEGGEPISEGRPLILYEETDEGWLGKQQNKELPRTVNY